MSSMTIAQLQTHVFSDKMQNIEALRPLIQKAKNSGADLVCLPEMFNCPYETPNFPVYAEKAGGPVWQALSDLAKEFGIYFSAGSVPECDQDGHVFNTAYVFDRSGKQIARHRKVHLFDIDVKGGQYFKESDTLTPLPYSTRNLEKSVSASVSIYAFRRSSDGWCWKVLISSLFRQPSI